jgi:hypothetical protein
MLRQHADGHGFRTVEIDGVAMSVHKLVAKSFVPQSGGLPMVEHANGMHHDNRASNLKWMM